MAIFRILKNPIFSLIRVREVFSELGSYMGKDVLDLKIKIGPNLFLALEQVPLVAAT
jgi:hypothetical protein